MGKIPKFHLIYYRDAYALPKFRRTFAADLGKLCPNIAKKKTTRQTKIRKQINNPFNKNE